MFRFIDIFNGCFIYSGFSFSILNFMLSCGSECSGSLLKDL